MNSEVVVPDQNVAAARLERGFLPSASSASRWRACPGSFMAELTIPEGEIETTEAALAGTRFHTLIEKFGNLFPGLLLLPLPKREDFAEMEDDAFWLFLDSIRYRNEAVIAFFGELEAVEPDTKGTVLREYRAHLRDPKTLDRITSGKIDEIVTFAAATLLIDYKSGRGSVEHAQGNQQLLVDTVCLAAEPGFGDASHWGVVIVQPLAETEKKWTMAVLTPDEVAFHAPLVASDAIRARLPDQPRVAGWKQCHYCDFKARCPEANAASWSIVEHAKGYDLTTPVTEAELDRIAQAEDFIETFKRARHKQALARKAANESDLPGWRVQGGSRKVTVTNTPQAFALLAEKIPASRFAEACDVSIVDLAKLWKDVTAAKSVKAAREQLEAVLAPVLAESIGPDTLRRR